MDARLRKRRGILRVSASRHIDCSVRRRPSRAGAFLRRAGKLVSSSSRPADAPALGLGVPHLQQPYSLWDRQHSPTALAMRRAVRSVLARRVPSSPYPSTSGGKSLILKRVADNRAPYSRFRFQDVSKPPLIRKCSKSRHSFEASPLSSGDYRRKARPSQAVTFQKPPLISGYQLNRRSFEQRSHFRRLSPPHFSKLIEVRTLKPNMPSRCFITPSKSWGFVHWLKRLLV